MAFILLIGESFFRIFDPFDGLLSACARSKARVEGELRHLVRQAFDKLKP
jgi:hypothetical protein